MFGALGDLIMYLCFCFFLMNSFMMIDVSVLKIWFGCLGLGVRMLTSHSMDPWQVWGLSKVQGDCGGLEGKDEGPGKDSDCMWLWDSPNHNPTNEGWWFLNFVYFYIFCICLSLLSLPLDHSFIQVGWWLWTLTRLWLAKATGESAAPVQCGYSKLQWIERMMAIFCGMEV